MHHEHPTWINVSISLINVLICLINVFILLTLINLLIALINVLIRLIKLYRTKHWRNKIYYINLCTNILNLRILEWITYSGARWHQNWRMCKKPYQIGGFPRDRPCDLTLAKQTGKPLSYQCAVIIGQTIAV